jgi:hypothetical protein
LAQLAFGREGGRAAEGRRTCQLRENENVADKADPFRPTLDELAEHDGWLIEDPQARHDYYPDSFWLPDDELRAGIGPGYQVRLLLWFVDEDTPDQLVAFCERMWVLVEARAGDLIEGRLASPPLSARAPLQMGERISFRATDVIDVLAPDEDWEDHRSFLTAMFDGDAAFEEWKRTHPHKLKPPSD